MVISHARTEDIDERESLMLNPALNQLSQVFLVGAETARYDVAPAAKAIEIGLIGFSMFP